MNRFSRDASKSSTGRASTGQTGAFPVVATVGRQNAATSPEEARRLLEEVQQLGSRMRNNRRRRQQIERRAAAYASRLARHTARLLQHMPHAVPTVRPIPGTGASTLRHYVLWHDQFESPSRTRLLVVSSDGRLRVCTVVAFGRASRLWNDYEVSNPPAGLGLSVVFEGLSSLIVKLESALNESEQEAADQEQALDGMIAESEAKLAIAGSRLSPVDPVSDNNDEDVPVFPAPQTGELRSYGFEHRISFGSRNAAPQPAAATSAAQPAAASPRAPGRFAR